jgi:hypothetical protein
MIPPMWIGRLDRGTTHPSNLCVKNTAAHCMPSFGDSRRTAGQLTMSPDKNYHSTCVLFSNAQINTFNGNVPTNWYLRICSQYFSLFYQHKKYIHNDKCTLTVRRSENNFKYSYLYRHATYKNNYKDAPWLMIGFCFLKNSSQVNTVMS